MSKLDDIVTDLNRQIDTGRDEHYIGTTLVQTAQLEALLAWAARVRELNPFLIGDRVALPVSDDPEDGEQPETGEVIGFAGGGGLLIRPETGEYSDTKTGLWYSSTDTERIED